MSGYLQYLPPAVWQEEGPGVTLGSYLQIVEKLLTGIDDEVVTPHPPIARLIDELPRTYDPWTTRADLLPFLASWVALDFPTLRGEPTWPEYQQRRVTSDIARIYRQRGLKTGLGAYIDRYATARTRPRVALDDGTRLVSITPRPAAPAVCAALLSQGPVTVGGIIREGPTRPWCVATGSDGSILLGDVSIPAGSGLSLPGRVWHLDASGQVDRTGAPPMPAPLAGATLSPTRAVAAAVTPGPPETLYVLDRSGRLFAVPAPWTPTSTATQVLTLATPGSTLFPVAMTVDTAGDLLVLDRGDGPGTSNPPKVITVRPSTGAVTRHPLPGVVEPLSIWAEEDGSLLIGDGGSQATLLEASEDLEGALHRVSRADWSVTPVLRPGHGLVAPTGLARPANGRLYVLDAGLKPFTPSSTDPFICAVAEPAAVYEIDPSGGAGPPVRISEPGLFVYPTGMAAAGDRLLVCDPGQPDVAGLQPFWSRIRPFTIDVVVHFVESRLPTRQQDRRPLLTQAVADLRSVIEEQKPAHTVWNLITAT